MDELKLIQAHHEYEARQAPFDLENILDMDTEPQSVEARAGQLIVEAGSLQRALAQALAHTLDGSTISQFQHDVYFALVMAGGRSTPQ